MSRKGVAGGRPPPHLWFPSVTPPVPPRVRAAILGLASAVTVASTLGTALAPLLLVKSPLGLVALSPAAHHIALAAATLPPLSLVVVATLRRTLTALAAYGLGYLYGPAALAWLEQRSPRVARWVRFIERQYARFGVSLLLVAPVPTIAVLAGAARSPSVRFLPALLAGLSIWTALAVFLGDVFARLTDGFTAFLGEYLLESTLICVGAVAAQQGLSLVLRRRRRSGLEGPVVAEQPSPPVG